MPEIYERIWSEMVQLLNKGDGAAAFAKFEEALGIAAIAAVSSSGPRRAR